jgi:hypothetical protein
VAGEQTEAGTIDTKKNNRILEVDKDISQELNR